MLHERCPTLTRVVCTNPMAYRGGFARGPKTGGITAPHPWGNPIFLRKCPANPWSTPLSIPRHQQQYREFPPTCMVIVLFHRGTLFCVDTKGNLPLQCSRRRSRALNTPPSAPRCRRPIVRVRGSPQLLLALHVRKVSERALLLALATRLNEVECEVETVA